MRRVIQSPHYPVRLETFAAIHFNPRFAPIASIPSADDFQICPMRRAAPNVRCTFSERSTRSSSGRSRVRKGRASSRKQSEQGPFSSCDDLSFRVHSQSFDCRPADGGLGSDRRVEFNRRPIQRVEPILPIRDRPATRVRPVPR